ncbi:MAG: ATP-dependent RNA helicase RhlE [Microgenomates bacterium 39_7]|nr:MAG: ATP-dependent RNA helicase RhlE [Microgenomates bacterium 39_7]
MSSSKRYQGNRNFRSRQSNRKIKSFNPSKLVNNAASIPVEVPKQEITHQFTDFGFNSQLEQNVITCGYKQPTPVQDQVIPEIINGRDVVGQANTGTGKTAAFLLPLINNLVGDQTKKVLIMTPTRELAVQIDEELQIFTKGLRIYSTLCIGGTSIGRQIKSLQKRPHFVIGTPERLIDLNKRRKLHLDQFKVIVLDEADRMLDMGFINDMKYVIEQVPSNIQTLFFSATIPEKLDRIIRQFTKNPVKITVQGQYAAANVDQKIIKIGGQSKVQVLLDLLKKRDFDKVLVFGRTKHGLNKLSAKLNQGGVKVAIIHGNRSQNQRQIALREFSKDRVQVLLATDVASRGLDIHNVTHVINYDLPESYEVYIHRIGRTGRANKTGSALSFVE